MKESEIQSQILKWLLYNGHFAWRCNNIAAPGRRFTGLRGVGDLLCVLPPHGQILSIEIKTLKGKQSVHQKQFEKNLEARGGIYLLARSLDDVISYFTLLDK